MFFDPKENKQTKDNSKIVTQDGFNFIDDDDDEPIILYEDYINQEIKSPKKEKKINEIDILDNDIDFDQIDNKSIDTIKQTNKSNDKKIIDKPKPTNQEKVNVQSNQKKQTKQDNVENQLNDQNHQKENQSNLHENELDKILTSTNDSDSLKSKNDDKKNSQKTNPELKNTDKSFLNYSNHVDKNIELVEIDDHKSQKTTPPVAQKSNPKTYFVSSTQKLKKTVQQEQANAKNEFQNIKDDDYNHYIIISGNSAKQVFQLKFIFSIVLIIVWGLLLIGSGLALTLGILCQIKKSNNFHFADYDYVPTVLAIILSASFFIYQLICILKFKFAKNEFISDKKIDEIDLIKVTKIYRHDKMFLNYFLWLLLATSFLFFLDLLIVFFVNHNSLVFVEHNFLFKFFVFSIVAYLFTIFVLIIYLISYFLLNRVIESDYNYQNNKILTYFKKLNQDSNFFGLITFLSCTVIGIIIYYIVKLVIYKSKNKKKKLHKKPITKTTTVKK